MPDNSVYYHIAYVLSAGIYAVYATTVYWRWMRLRNR